jgi:hypothetical protein
MTKPNAMIDMLVLFQANKVRSAANNILGSGPFVIVSRLPSGNEKP